MTVVIVGVFIRPRDFQTATSLVVSFQYGQIPSGAI